MSLSKNYTYADRCVQEALAKAEKAIRCYEEDKQRPYSDLNAYFLWTYKR